MKTDEFHFCQRCNWRLRSAKAIQEGMGSVCKQKHLADKEAAAQQKDSNSK